MKPESQIGELGNRQDDIMASRGIFIGFSFLFVFSFFFFFTIVVKTDMSHRLHLKSGCSLTNNYSFHNIYYNAFKWLFLCIYCSFK